MKFINYLTAITGIEIYPLISFTIFGIFFLIVGYWAFSIPKHKIDHFSNLPLDDDTNFEKYEK